MLGDVEPLSADDDSLDLSGSFVDLVDLRVSHQLLDLKKRKNEKKKNDYEIYSVRLRWIGNKSESCEEKIKIF